MGTLPDVGEVDCFNFSEFSQRANVADRITFRCRFFSLDFQLSRLQNRQQATSISHLITIKVLTWKQESEIRKNDIFNIIPSLAELTRHSPYTQDKLHVNSVYRSVLKQHRTAGGLHKKEKEKKRKKENLKYSSLFRDNNSYLLDKSTSHQVSNAPLPDRNTDDRLGLAGKCGCILHLNESSW